MEIPFIIKELIEGFFKLWLHQDFEVRWVIATIILGSPAIYIFETFRYLKLLRAKGTVHLAPISVRGIILEALGHNGVARALHAELFSINKTLLNIFGNRPAPYIAPATKRDTGYYLVGLRQEAPLPKGIREEKVQKIEQELTLRIGKFTLPISPLLNFMIMVMGALPVYGRRRYTNSLIQVSMLSSGDQTCLTVYKPESYARFADKENEKAVLPSKQKEPTDLTKPESGNRENQTEGIEKASLTYKEVIFTETKRTKTLADVNSLIRDAAFMILQIHNTFGKRNWQSMRYLMDGLEALENNRRTGEAETINLAQECFRRAANEDPMNNHEALYYHGIMTMVSRTAESIDESIMYFERAMETENSQLKALTHTGLTYCYVQQFHRFGKRNVDVLKKAEKHAEDAEREWKRAQEEAKENQGSLQDHALIPYTLALVLIVDERELDYKERSREDRFLEAASKCDKAIRQEPSNGMFYNVVGWIFLKLAEWKMEKLPEGVKLSEEDPERRIYKLSEQYLHKSLGLSPNNKLTHANLCLLYSTEWFRQDEKYKERYLARCRYHGLKAIQIDKNYINGHRDLTVALIRYGKLDEAYDFYTKALKLAEDPDKDQEIISDIESELKKLEDQEKLEEYFKLSNYGWDDWKNPDQKLLEPHQKN